MMPLAGTDSIEGGGGTTGRGPWSCDGSVSFSVVDSVVGSAIAVRLSAVSDSSGASTANLTSSTSRGDGKTRTGKDSEFDSFCSATISGSTEAGVSEVVTLFTGCCQGSMTGGGSSALAGPAGCSEGDEMSSSTLPTISGSLYGRAELVIGATGVVEFSESRGSVTAAALAARPDPDLSTDATGLTSRSSGAIPGRGAAPARAASRLGSAGPSIVAFAGAARWDPFVGSVRGRSEKAHRTLVRASRPWGP